MRVVLDTNVLVSAIVFSRHRMSWLRQAWQTGKIQPVMDRSTAAELLRVLAYPKFQLTATEQEELLGDFLPYAQTVTQIDDNPGRPRCTDPNDQMFITLAVSVQVDALVSGDTALLALAGQLTLPVLTVDQLRRQLDAA